MNFLSVDECNWAICKCICWSTFYQKNFFKPLLIKYTIPISEKTNIFTIHKFDEDNVNVWIESSLDEILGGRQKEIYNCDT